ncbi:MAG: hypothetical protein Q8K12_17600 [Thiobacillus sp.]|nr:hypothetical protein [Thiobacillus sp.]
MMIAVLFARADSVYKTLPDLDVYDELRDARNYTGDSSVIAHPPCRAWGRLRHFAKPQPHEKDLALFAVNQVQTLGGVLEHPSGSTLWPSAGLPRPGLRDKFGGFTFPCSQKWWGHKFEKRTWLYVVGVEPSELPPFPINFHRPLLTMGSPGEGSKADREHTPYNLALWLVDLAARCKKTSVAA